MDALVERLQSFLESPTGAQALLPIVAFLEALPDQKGEEALIRLVGSTALAITRSPQGGIQDASGWRFLVGTPPASPDTPEIPWIRLPWHQGDLLFGHLLLPISQAPPALHLLLTLSAHLMAWRRMGARQREQSQTLALQLSRLDTLFELTQSLSEMESKSDILFLSASTAMAEFLLSRLLVVDRDGSVLFHRGLGDLPAVLSPQALEALRRAKGLKHAAELCDPNRSHGFVYAPDPRLGPLEEEGRQFLQTILKLTSTHLSAMELREAKLRALDLEKDLELARNIQRRLLPARLPEPAGWQCAAVNLSYQKVGGDLYDLWTAGEALNLAVADVSGKGLPASLMMAQLSAFLRAMADGPVNDWGLLAQRLNVRMNEVRDRNRYATLFAGSLDTRTGKIRFVNGGHLPPLLLPGDGSSPVQLQPTGPMVGLLPDATFREGSAALAPGDTLIVFTDGLSEAESLSGTELGIPPLLDTLRHHAQASADEMLEQLLVTAFRHMEGSGFQDDVTLMVIKRSRTS